jgi:hypothetical protein
VEFVLGIVIVFFGIIVVSTGTLASYYKVFTELIVNEVEEKFKER